MLGDMVNRSDCEGLHIGYNARDAFSSHKILKNAYFYSIINLQHAKYTVIRQKYYAK